MDRMISNYITAIDELNLLMGASSGAEETADTLLSALIGAYRLGISDAADMLGMELRVNLDEMEAAIYAVFDGKTFEDRVADHVLSNSPGRLKSLGESEFHRVYNRALCDGANQFQTQTGKTVFKTWCTMLDEKVRDTHDYLEAMRVPLNQDFYTWDGDHAPCPGGFSKVDNNANCRCVLDFSTDVW